MFHALAAHCAFSHRELRLALDLREHISTFASFFTADEDINAYLTSMAQPGTWGDSLVLTAAAELLHALSMLLSHMVYILSHLRTQLVTLSGSHTTVLHTMIR